MNEQRMRNIFAEELERNGAQGMAQMVKYGVDNSNGGMAAIAAMKRIQQEIMQEIEKETRK